MADPASAPARLGRKARPRGPRGQHRPQRGHAEASAAVNAPAGAEAPPAALPAPPTPLGDGSGDGSLSENSGADESMLEARSDSDPEGPSVARSG
eukprot:14492541-Alexandrium_andersonii.AAC.1